MTQAAVPALSISVIVPCYNVGPYVGAALNSLIAQSFVDWQVFVIDDGSTDGTASLVEAYTDKRIVLFRQANQGVSAARNLGLKQAAGDAVLFLDADDWLAPDALGRMAAALLQYPQAAAVYGAFCFVSEDGGTVVRRKAGPFVSGAIIERLLVENLFANGGHVLIRRWASNRAGGFRSDLSFGEDWEYWCRLALQGSIELVPGDAALLFVRQRNSGAYLRMATDPEAFVPCTEAIFANPMLPSRLGSTRLRQLRRQVEAENDWIIGREMLRHARRPIGLIRLRRSFRGKPSAKRALLLAIAHLLPILPKRLEGPFRPYGGATS